MEFARDGGVGPVPTRKKNAMSDERCGECGRALPPSIAEVSAARERVAGHAIARAKKALKSKSARTVAYELREASAMLEAAFFGSAGEVLEIDRAAREEEPTP